MHPHSFNLQSKSLRAVFAVRFLALAVALGIANPLLNAQVFTEIGDAGQTPGTAQNTGLSQPANGGTAIIFGTLTSPTDADIFRINVINPIGFSASTVNLLTRTSGGPGGLDTQLFLFDSLFRPIVMNDDASGIVLQSTIPGYSSFVTSLSAGVYYLAIALAGNDPANIANQLLFAMNGGDTTAVRGAASGISPNTLDHFTGGTTFPEQGAYQINIFNVPETGSTLLLIGVGFAGLMLMRSRVAAKATRRS